MCCVSPARGCWCRRRRSRPPTTAPWSARCIPRIPMSPRSSSWAPTTGNAYGVAPTRCPRPPCASRMDSLQSGDPINIQYTSGTTGSPKGATLSHRNILNNGFFVTELINLGPGDRLCIPVPFYHCFGMVMGNLGCTTHGATMVIPAAGFDPAATLASDRKGALHRPLRCADDVHRDAWAPRPRRPRSVVAAHRDHGGSHLPDGAHEALRRRAEHVRGWRSPTA